MNYTKDIYIGDGIISISLQHYPDRPVFTASFNNGGSCGQCFDTVKDNIDNPIFKQIYRLWNLYHLNSVRAGTVNQELALRSHFGNIDVNYDEACDYLKSINLLYDKEQHDYKYGSGWNYLTIPSKDLQEILRLFKGNSW